MATWEEFKSALEKMGIADVEVIKASAKRAGIKLPKPSNDKDRVRFETDRHGDVIENAVGLRTILVPNVVEKDGTRTLMRPYAFPANRKMLLASKAETEKRLAALGKALDFLDAAETLQNDRLTQLAHQSVKGGLKVNKKGAIDDSPPPPRD